MRYYQPQGHFRLFTTQFRESVPNNQDCQTPSLSKQPIFQTTRLSHNIDSQKSDIKKKLKQTGQNSPHGSPRSWGKQNKPNLKSGRANPLLVEEEQSIRLQPRRPAPPRTPAAGW